MKETTILFRVLVILICTGCEGRSREDDFAFAAGKGDLTTLSNLYTKILDINKQEKGFLGNTPLTAAIWFNQPKAVSFLLAKGANLEARNREGDTPLLVAVTFTDGYKDILPLLIQAGANLNATNTSGFSVLYFAKQTGHESILPMLLQAGAQLSRHDELLGNGDSIPDASSFTNPPPVRIN